VEIEASVTEYLVAHIAIVGMQRAQVSPAIRTLFGGRKIANEPLDLFEDDTADIRLCGFADQDFWRAGTQSPEAHWYFRL
jgi:hypothetical protein